MRKFLIYFPLLISFSLLSLTQDRSEITVVCPGSCDEEGAIRSFHMYDKKATKFVNMMLTTRDKKRGKNVVFHFKKEQIEGIEENCTVSIFEGAHHLKPDFKHVFYPFHSSEDRQARLANLDKRTVPGIVVHIKVGKIDEIDTKEKEDLALAYLESIFKIKVK